MKSGENLEKRSDWVESAIEEAARVEAWKNAEREEREIEAERAGLGPDDYGAEFFDDAADESDGVLAIPLDEIVDMVYKGVMDRLNTDNVIDFMKLRDVKSPTRGNSNDAGTDFYIPEYSKQFGDELLELNTDTPGLTLSHREDEKGDRWTIGIPPHSKVMIPSGIKVNIHDKDTYLAAKNKGGIATSQGLIKTAQVIDADFRGEVFFGLVNPTDDVATVRTGEKIIQLVQQRFCRPVFNELTPDEFASLPPTDRGEGARGSTGL